MTEPRDPGLQPERTALSWERTSTGLLANAAIILLRPQQPFTPSSITLAGLAIGSAATIAVLGRRRSRTTTACAATTEVTINTALLTAFAGAALVTTFSL
jgi:hypothetical protein